MPRRRRHVSPPSPATTLLQRSWTDAAVFVEVYDLYAKRVVVFLTRSIYDAELAFDLHQEVFAIVWEKRRTFRGSTTAEEEAWIFAIARNQAARYHRRGSVEREAVRRLGLARPALSDESLDRVEELADIHGIKGDIEAALQGLPPEQREAVELRVVRELSYEQVAEQLGITQPNARARVSRGLRALALAIRPELEDAVA